ncbi:YwhD family protein [Bacillus sp. FJAT-49736]|uniref:YwhD family protein n=1 Tax=Bacillus sp. FJAT-49736 TaxID=2833582 RepID=UPI001BCA623D|nr:YwhD family protein [Bacillus sp. FJAT-49736]MBS4175379.1 YwhD family protein [Bacillus sp. FJAT-49736]
MESGKNKLEFNIIKKDPRDEHKGFGMGSLSLDNVSPVIIDIEAGEAVVDIGAMHGKSAVEKRVKFLPNKEEVPAGAKSYWLVWVTIARKEDGLYYAGATACEMTVNKEARRGYKSLPEHVNRLDKSLKRQIIVDHMDEKSKRVLADFLKNHDENMWNRSSEQLKKDLGVSQ